MTAADNEIMTPSNRIFTKVRKRIKSRPKENSRYRESIELGWIDRLCSDLESATNTNASTKKTIATATEVFVVIEA
jgi:hypothetical protein